MKIILVCAAAAAMVLGSVSASLADREPTDAELALIEGVLWVEGFRDWDAITFDDDGYWVVDDAIAADGRSRDVKLDERFALLESDPD
jgi:hypothetical protein